MDHRLLLTLLLGLLLVKGEEEASVETVPDDVETVGGVWGRVRDPESPIVHLQVTIAQPSSLYHINSSRSSGAWKSTRWTGPCSKRSCLFPVPWCSLCCTSSHGTSLQAPGPSLGLAGSSRGHDFCPQVSSEPPWGQVGGKRRLSLLECLCKTPQSRGQEACYCLYSWRGLHLWTSQHSYWTIHDGTGWCACHS